VTKTTFDFFFVFAATTIRARHRERVDPVRVPAGRAAADAFALARLSLRGRHSSLFLRHGTGFGRLPRRRRRHVFLTLALLRHLHPDPLLGNLHLARGGDEVFLVLAAAASL
jgi:hypothetical protein